MRESDRRTIAAAAVVVGAAFGAIAIAAKAQRDAEVGEWKSRVRDAVGRADQLTKENRFTAIVAASRQGDEVLKPAEQAHVSAVGAQDEVVQSVRGWQAAVLEAPDDRNTVTNMARALNALSHQGQTGMNYANALVEALSSQIAERKLGNRPPRGLA